ncbi:unnamed protein product [Spirodela intermedia]|uniref:Uncharacterized protein n=1 Tax=Spirodela intermedia TaxID=51605 RepID=A0A7I8JQG0_SPIIN|nr:unnamed protein product [Spirodela intermedia]CAA6671662.1 unnamed protein product [Spirodela intermedia]
MEYELTARLERAQPLVLLPALAALRRSSGYLYAPYWEGEEARASLIAGSGSSPLASKPGPTFGSASRDQYAPSYMIVAARSCAGCGHQEVQERGNRSLPSPIFLLPLHQRASSSQVGHTKHDNLPLPALSPPNLIPNMQSLIEAAFSSLEKGPALKSPSADRLPQLAPTVIGQARYFAIDFRPLQEDHRSGGPVDDEISPSSSSSLLHHLAEAGPLRFPSPSCLGLLAPILREPFRQAAEAEVPGHCDLKMERSTERSKGGVDLPCRDFLSAILKAGSPAPRRGGAFCRNYVSALTSSTSSLSRQTSFTLSSVLTSSRPPPRWTAALEEIDALRARGCRALGRRSSTASSHHLPRLLLQCKVPCGLHGIQLVARWFVPHGEEEKHRHPYAHNPFWHWPAGCMCSKFSLREIKPSPQSFLYRRYISAWSPAMQSPLASSMDRPQFQAWG